MADRRIDRPCVFTPRLVALFAAALKSKSAPVINESFRHGALSSAILMHRRVRGCGRAKWSVVRSVMLRERLVARAKQSGTGAEQLKLCVAVQCSLAIELRRCRASVCLCSW